MVSKLFEYNKKVSVKIYPGAYHTFFNSKRPTIYNRRTCEDSWRLLMSFYREIFGM
jgi:carboxymethylenebutenolidase